jgi:hypothetical protein
MSPAESSRSKRLRDQRLYRPAVKARRVDHVGSFGAGIGPDQGEAVIVLPFTDEFIGAGVVSCLTPISDPCARGLRPCSAGRSASRNQAPSFVRSRLRVR